MDNMSYGQRKFKVGDKVVCVNIDTIKGLTLMRADYLTIGETYVVKSFDVWDGKQQIHIEGIMSTPFSVRFKLASVVPIVKSDWL